jgi:hypothetical protein
MALTSPEKLPGIERRPRRGQGIRMLKKKEEGDKDEL